MPARRVVLQVTPLRSELVFELLATTNALRSAAHHGEIGYLECSEGFQAVELGSELRLCGLRTIVNEVLRLHALQVLVWQSAGEGDEQA